MLSLRKLFVTLPLILSFVTPLIAPLITSQPSFAQSNSQGKSKTTPRPKLLLVIVFDQFRADYLSRFEKLFLPANHNGQVGGFKYLMDTGAYYPDGEYDILESMTGPGHATILTGAYPYLNGIVTNNWFDQQTQKQLYCAEDPKYSTVGFPTEEHVGTSPNNMISSTVGDELKNAGFPSHVVSLALKDRAAILMGGHRPDLAMWFDGAARQWTSSDFYLPSKKLPDWMLELNAGVKKSEGATIQWEKQQDSSENGSKKNNAEIKQNKTGMAWDESIPANILTDPVKTGSHASYGMSYGSQLTEQAFEKAFDHYQMGQQRGADTATDLFAVSFSSHDIAGHAFGPNSREMELMTQSEDRVLSQLLNFVKKRVPLKDVTIVLTGDHGIPPNPKWLATHGFGAGQIGDGKNLVPEITKALDEKFGKPKTPWFGFVQELSYFLSSGALQETKAPLAEVEALAKNVLLAQKGVAFVFTSSEYAARKLPPGMHERQILHTYYPGRSANITIIPQPFYVASNSTADHMTGYSYDRTVPVILAGFGIKPGRYSSKANVIDIAPTLTFLSGVVAPSLSEGRVLSEALK
jgi:predicted AlkP superfamily pyrophosphatase or phosphodiesterase